MADDPVQRAAEIHRLAAGVHERAAHLDEASAELHEEHAHEMHDLGREDAARRAILIVARERAEAIESEARADDGRAMAATEAERAPDQPSRSTA